MIKSSILCFSAPKSDGGGGGGGGGGAGWGGAWVTVGADCRFQPYGVSEISIFVSESSSSSAKCGAASVRCPQRRCLLTWVGLSCLSPARDRRPRLVAVGLSPPEPGLKASANTSRRDAFPTPSRRQVTREVTARTEIGSKEALMVLRETNCPQICVKRLKRCNCRNSPPPLNHPHTHTRQIKTDR